MADSSEKKTSLELIAAPAVEKRIFVVRERQVMLDEDLADLYGVETKVLIQQIKRNAKRFPSDFMFQLDKAEAEALRSQIVTSKRRVASSYAALQERLEELEGEMTERLDRHDEQLDQIFKALHQLISPPQRPKRPVGFRIRDDE